MRISCVVRSHAAAWSAPVAWSVFSGLMLALGRTDGLHAVIVSGVALLGAGATRAMTHTRGGLAGRVAELVLFGGAVAWMLASPASHRDVTSLAASLAASGLALAGAWHHAGDLARERLALAAGGVIGLTVASGMVGAPSWGLKAMLVVVCVALTAHVLVRIAGAALAIAATVALAVAIGPAHAAAWLLPPLAAVALVALGAELPWTTAGAGVLAAALPPAGLAVAAGLIVASARKMRSAWPLALLPAAALVGWWRLPPGAALVHAPSLGALGAMLPLSPFAVPFLLPAAVIGLAGRTGAPADARDALGAGMLLIPFVAGGPWTMAAAASLWLAALPAARTQLPAVRTTLPWTFGAGGALLLAMPWGGAVLPGLSPLLLVGGWLLGVAAALTGWRAAALAWVLPVAGLVWTAPVEGVDHHLAPGGTMELPARAGGWILLAGTPLGTIAPGTPVVSARTTTGTGGAGSRGSPGEPCSSWCWQAWVPGPAPCRSQLG